MAKTDTTPFRDARNAVGLLTDVFDLALEGPKLTPSRFPDREVLRAIVTARDLGREFAKSSRRVFNGYARKSHSGLYQRVKDARTKLPAESYLLDAKILDLYATIGSIGDRSLSIVETVMEDATQWTKYTTGWVERPSYGPHVTHDPQWHRDWHDHVSSALRLGADREAIANLECSWRFRDLTDRSHRGRNIRAAFEAAWLAGQYKFAQQLIAQEFK